MGTFAVVLKKIRADSYHRGLFRTMNHFALYTDFEIISRISLIYGDHGFDFCTRNRSSSTFCILFTLEDHLFLAHELAYNDS